ncbi:MAG TPA: hypothetical protein VGJ44_25770, partial [Kribbellaceae bacterium]
MFRSRIPRCACAAALTITLTAALAPGGRLAVAASAELPCMSQANGMGFRIDFPLAPNTVSHVTLVFPGPGEGAPDQQRFVSRPDGSEKEVATFQAATWPSGGVWIGTHPREMGLRDGGHWVLYDAYGRPWQRFVAQYDAHFSATQAPTRIVTAGDLVTVGVTMVGWTAESVERPVVGRPILINSYTPYWKIDWQRISAPTNTSGVAAYSFHIPSNRWINMLPYPYGCYLHSGSRASSVLHILVRKRITRVVSDLTPTPGQTVRIAGTVFPAATSQPVYLQRWNGSGFVSIVAGRTTRAADGAY